MHIDEPVEICKGPSCSACILNEEVQDFGYHVSAELVGQLFTTMHRPANLVYCGYLCLACTMDAACGLLEISWMMPSGIHGDSMHVRIVQIVQEGWCVGGRNSQDFMGISGMSNSAPRRKVHRWAPQWGHVYAGRTDFIKQLGLIGSQKTHYHPAGRCCRSSSTLAT